MRPYYEHAGITIYHGDCREILPTLSAPAIITDPVWPRPTKLLAASGDPWQLFREMCEAIPASVLRMTVHLGVISDPRFLFPVPERLPFFRVCWLAQIPCSFVGRVLNGANVAYIFGQPPAGTGILPGECLDTGGGTYRNGLGRNRSQKAYHAVRSEMPHPAARRLGHLRWLGVVELVYDLDLHLAWIVLCSDALQTFLEVLRRCVGRYRDRYGRPVGHSFSIASPKTFEYSKRSESRFAFCAILSRSSGLSSMKRIALFSAYLS